MGNSHGANRANTARVQQAQRATSPSTRRPRPTPPHAYQRLSPAVASAVRNAYRQAQRASVYLDAVRAAQAAVGGLDNVPAARHPQLAPLGELLLLPSPSSGQRAELEGLTRAALASRAGEHGSVDETPRGRDSTAQMALALHSSVSGDVGAFPRSFAQAGGALRYTSATLYHRLQTADRARARVLALLPG